MSETSTFDHYEVLKRDDGSLFELGRGAMGITYKAFDTNLRIPVALKVINAASIHSDIARQRFVREARAAALLRHRNVASVFHLGIEGDTYFYAMEFIDGETVESLIRRQGPLDPVLALRIATQVARSLNAAQKHHLVHRDIKPSNLMLVHEDEELVVKVIDFGLAKSSRKDDAEETAALSAGGFVGTPHFASPEQLEEKEIDVRSDIYSLGVTLWYMLAGRAPFGGTLAQVMSQHLREPPPFENIPGLPAPIVALLDRMLAKDPALRFQTPAELRKELEGCIEILANGGNIASAAPDFPAQIAGPSKFKAGAMIAGRYKILEDLGETNTGQAFRARQQSSQIEVRILVLNPELIANPETYTLLEREVEKIQPVEHRNLLRVFELERVDDASLLVLESTAGFSLLDVLRSRRELTPPEALAFLKQAAVGVDYATQTGLKRLDLALHQIAIHFAEPVAPMSALLDRQIQQWPQFLVKLNPLGITRELSMSETWAGGQTIVGGMTSVPREVTGANIAAKYIQSLSAIIYELLGGTLSPLMLGGTGTQPAPRYVPISTLSEEGNAVLKRALDPAQSFPSAQHFFHELRQTEGDEPHQRGAMAPAPQRATSHPPQEIGATSIPAPSKRGSKIALIVGAMLAGALLGLVLLHLPSRPEPEAEPQPVAVTPTPPIAVATPAPTAIPIETPKPPPSRQELLGEAVADAEKLEAAGDWAKCLPAYVRIAKDFPESDSGKVRLELILERLRNGPEKLDDARFDALRGPITDAAKLNVVSAMMLLGERLRKREPVDAFNWFSTAAALGHTPALTQVGLMYSNGAGVPRDFTRAIWWFNQGSEKGHAPAKTCLAECYMYGRGVRKDERRAIGILQDAVAGGDARAMNLLGTCFHQGTGTGKNFEEAFRLFTQASERGFLDALGNIGVLYVNGDGVREDPQKAVELFQRGSKAGNAYCMFLYARCLESGSGVDGNRLQAEAWYKRSAEGGNPRAAEWCRRNGIPFEVK